ncbi:MAG: biotin/lipoyl-binding protein, partial [Cyanobacteria bacterium P01_D01_bin.56]
MNTHNSVQTALDTAPPDSRAYAPEEQQQLSPESVSVWSTALQNTLDHPPAQFPYRLLTGGILFCMAFSVWAYVGKVEEVGSARGQLVPQGEVYKVMPVQQGKVSDILVKEGDLVTTDQVILRLDNRLDLTEVSRLEQSLAAARNQLQQTQVLVGKTHLDIQTRQSGAQADTQAQIAAINRAESNVDTTQALIHQ